MFEVKSRLEKAHDAEIWALACKGDRIVTGSVDGKVKIWTFDLEKSKEIDASALGIISLDIKGNQLLVSSMDSHLRIYNIETGDLIKDIDAGPVNAWQARFQPNSDFIGTTGQSGHISVWDISSGNQVKTLKPANTAFSTVLAYNSDGSLAACCSKDGVVTIFNTTTGQPVIFEGEKASIEAHVMTIRATSFSPDGITLLTAGDDRHINLFDTKTGDKLASLSGHASPVLGAAYSPNGRYFASCSGDQKVKIWSTTDNECITTLAHHGGQVWGVVWGYNSDKLVSVSDDMSIIIYKCF